MSGVLFFLLIFISFFGFAQITMADSFTSQQNAVLDNALNLNQIPETRFIQPKNNSLIFKANDISPAPHQKNQLRKK